MQFEFDEKIDQSIQKSIKAAGRLYKERQKLAQESGNRQSPPSYEEFESEVMQIMESNKQAELNKLRTLGLKDLFDRAWAQRLLNYATRKDMRDSHEALMRRY